MAIRLISKQLSLESKAHRTKKQYAPSTLNPMRFGLDVSENGWFPKFFSSGGNLHLPN